MVTVNPIQDLFTVEDGSARGQDLALQCTKTIRHTSVTTLTLDRAVIMTGPSFGTNVRVIGGLLLPRFHFTVASSSNHPRQHALCHLTNSLRHDTESWTRRPKRALSRMTSFNHNAAGQLAAISQTTNLPCRGARHTWSRRLKSTYSTILSVRYIGRTDEIDNSMQIMKSLGRMHILGRSNSPMRLQTDFCKADIGSVQSHAHEHYERPTNEAVRNRRTLAAVPFTDSQKCTTLFARRSRLR